MTRPTRIDFLAGAEGAWRIERITAVIGPTLPDAERLDLRTGPPDAARPPLGAPGWRLSGIVGHLRYTTRDERAILSDRQEGLGRPNSTRAALIPIRKSPAWWDLAQDERRAILEDRSRHIAIGLEYLPAVARRLHHSRDLGEPFDFLTWFEFAPEAETAFDELLARLRASPEWDYVDREVDVRLYD